MAGDLGFRVYLGFRVEGLGLRTSGLGFTQGLGLRTSGLGLGV